MRHARETFLFFLSTNLPGVNIINRRFDKNDPSLSELTQNAVGVEFIYDRPGIIESGLQVVIDVIYDDELTAIETVQAIWRILRASEITPLISYDAGLSSPVPLGTMLRWDVKQVKFNKLVSEVFFRYNCHLFLSYCDPT